MTQLGLGCANLGMKYGNSDRLMPEDEAIAILTAAYDGGIRHFDSARAYDLADTRVAAALDGKDVELCTKITSGLDSAPPKAFRTIYLHDIGILNPWLKTPAHYTWGVSVYTVEDADRALRWRQCKLLQVPVNILDQRFIEPSFVKRCKDKGVRLVARSIFLQGVLIPDAPLPEVKKKDKLQELRALLPGEAFYDSMRYIFGTLIAELDVGLVGVNSLGQLKETLGMYDKAKLDPLTMEELEKYSKAAAFAAEHKLYDPRTWT